MNHQLKDIGFKNTIFEYPDLTRIMGKVITATLITLQIKFKGNAQAVHLTLGGGKHGHLELVFCL